MDPRDSKSSENVRREYRMIEDQSRRLKAIVEAVDAAREGEKKR